MNYKLVISPEAFRDIELAECFYKTKDLDKSFLKDLNAQFNFLENAPLSRQIRYRNIRIHLLEIYKYSVHYIVDNDVVMVLRVLNQAQEF